MKYKLVEDEDLMGGGIFADSCLTQLMILEVNSRKNIKSSLSTPLYKLLGAFLRPYGIYIGGATHLDDYLLQSVAIKKDFPVENEIILRNLYDFTGGEVNIQLHLDSDEDCAYGFQYNLVDRSCTLERYYHFSTTYSKKYETLEKMLKGLKSAPTLPHNK